VKGARPEQKREGRARLLLLRGLKPFKVRAGDVDVAGGAGQGGFAGAFQLNVMAVREVEEVVADLAADGHALAAAPYEDHVDPGAREAAGWFSRERERWERERERERDGLREREREAHTWSSLGGSCHSKPPCLRCAAQRAHHPNVTMVKRDDDGGG
jgi:hypothetical protein